MPEQNTVMLFICIVLLIIRMKTSTMLNLKNEIFELLETQCLVYTYHIHEYRNNKKTKIILKILFNFFKYNNGQS
jgi:hypothetical protein